MAIRRIFIREAVENLLINNNVNHPPVSAENIARNLDLQISYQPAEDELSGFLLRDNKSGNAIIGVNEKHSKNRKNFTVAHEIGHFLLHEGDLIHVDRSNAGFSVKLRNEEASKGTDVDEIEANLFAAELLMPARFIEKDISKLGSFDLQDDGAEEDLIKLAKKYGVSTQALTIRLINLGYIESHK